MVRLLTLGKFKIQIQATTGIAGNLYHNLELQNNPTDPIPILNGTVTMSGGSITGNNINGTRPVDVYLWQNSFFEPSGNANIGGLMLEATSAPNPVDNSKIRATGTYTGTIGVLYLYFNNTSASTVGVARTRWEDEQVIIGTTANITSVLSRITSLENFYGITSPAGAGNTPTAPITDTHHICATLGPNHGRLILGTKASCGCP